MSSFPTKQTKFDMGFERIQIWYVDSELVSNVV